MTASDLPSNHEFEEDMLFSKDFSSYRIIFQESSADNSEFYFISPKEVSTMLSSREQEIVFDAILELPAIIN